MSLTRYWNIANAFELRPGIGSRVVSPDIAEPSDAVGTAKEIQLLVPCYNSVVRTCRRNLSVGRASVDGVLDQSLPSVAGLLQRIEVKCN